MFDFTIPYACMWKEKETGQLSSNYLISKSGQMKYSLLLKGPLTTIRKDKRIQVPPQTTGAFLSRNDIIPNREDSSVLILKS